MEETIVTILKERLEHQETRIERLFDTVSELTVIVAKSTTTQEVIAKNMEKISNALDSITGQLNSHQKTINSHDHSIKLHEKVFKWITSGTGAVVTFCIALMTFANEIREYLFKWLNH